MYLFFDTETSDLPNFKASNSHPSQPWIVQLAAILTNECNKPFQTISLIIRSNGLPMTPEAETVHGISVEIADTYGITSANALGMFLDIASKADYLIAHNISFDFRLLSIMATRICQEAKDDIFQLKENKEHICTMRSTTKLCALPYPSGKAGCKWPKLEELYYFLFSETLEYAHDALADVNATRRCFFELKRRELI